MINCTPLIQTELKCVLFPIETYLHKYSSNRFTQVQYANDKTLSILTLSITLCHLTLEDSF